MNTRAAQATAQLIFLEMEKEKALRRLSNVESIFQEDQLVKLNASASSKTHWSDVTLKNSIKLYYTCGNTGYELMRSMKQPLPHVTTLRRHLTKIDFEPGTLHDIFILMRQKVENGSFSLKLHVS